MEASGPSGGRPTPFLKPDGQEIWTKEEIAQAAREKLIPPAEYAFKCLDPKLKSKSIKIDFSMNMEKHEISTGNVGPQGEMIQTTDTSLLVDSVIKYTAQDRNRIRELEDRIETLTEENTDLKIELATIQATLKYKEKDTSMGGIIERSLENLMQGPGGSVLAGKLLEKMGMVPPLSNG